MGAKYYCDYCLRETEEYYNILIKISDGRGYHGYDQRPYLVLNYLCKPCVNRFKGGIDPWKLPPSA